MNKLFRFPLLVNISFLLLFLNLTCTTPEAGQSAASDSGTQSAPQFAEKISKAQYLMRQHMKENDIPGATIAVSVDGQTVWAEGFGLADVENRVPVLPSTKMRVGSVSKSLTSAAIGLPYEQGKLDVDVEVQQYVPSFPKKRYPINIRQVAGHLAGIRHYKGNEFLISKHYDTVLEGLTIFADDPLLFEPGEKYSYSSYGWNLVSAIVEGAAEQDFLSYMQEYVFRPLGMHNTIADHAYNIIQNRTRFYVHDNNRLINAPFVDNSYKWAGGGYLSTAEDLLRFGEGMINGDFLKPETVELLFKSQKTNSGEETNYGLGWRSSDELDGRRSVGHGGGSIGGSSYFIMFPAEKTVVAVICNLSGGNWGEPAKEILKLFTSKESFIKK